MTTQNKDDHGVLAWFFAHKFDEDPKKEKAAACKLVPLFFVIVAIGIWAGVCLRDETKVAADAYPSLVSELYLGAGIFALVVTFAALMARGLTPAGFTGISIGAAVVISRFAASGFTIGYWINLGVFVLGLVAILVCRKRLRALRD